MQYVQYMCGMCVFSSDCLGPSVVDPSLTPFLSTVPRLLGALPDQLFLEVPDHLILWHPGTGGHLQTIHKNTV